MFKINKLFFSNIKILPQLSKQVISKPRLLECRNFTQRSLNSTIQNNRNSNQINKYSLIFRSFVFTAGVIFYQQCSLNIYFLNFNQFSGIAYSIATVINYERHKRATNSKNKSSHKFSKKRTEVHLIISNSFKLIKIHFI